MEELPADWMLECRWYESVTYALHRMGQDEDALRLMAWLSGKKKALVEGYQREREESAV